MRTSKTPPYVKEGEGERRGGLGERKGGDGEGGEGGTKRVGVRRRDTKYINKAKCSAVTNYTSYYVAEHGAVNGTQNMMAEILARG